MAENQSIKVIKKEGTATVFEITFKKESPLIIIPEYKGASIEDILLYILNTAQQNLHDQVMKITY